MINGLILSVDRKQMSNTIVIIDWCNKHGGKIGKENDREKEINDADKSFSLSVKAWK